MQRTELHEEITGLADSLDEHVGPTDAAAALRALADRLESEGIFNEPAEAGFTPDAPRYPEVSLKLIGRDAGLLSIASRAATALRKGGVDAAQVDEFFNAVTSKTSYEEALHEVTCWVSVALPEGTDYEG